LQFRVAIACAGRIGHSSCAHRISARRVAGPRTPFSSRAGAHLANRHGGSPWRTSRPNPSTFISGRPPTAGRSRSCRNRHAGRKSACRSVQSARPMTARRAGRDGQAIPVPRNAATIPWLSPCQSRRFPVPFARGENATAPRFFVLNASFARSARGSVHQRFIARLKPPLKSPGRSSRCSRVATRAGRARSS
jgi:hypothetical protein